MWSSRANIDHPNYIAFHQTVTFSNLGHGNEERLDLVTTWMGDHRNPKAREAEKAGWNMAMAKHL